jgi:hypothetical protein
MKENNTEAILLTIENFNGFGNSTMFRYQKWFSLTFINN